MAFTIIRPADLTKAATGGFKVLRPATAEPKAADAPSTFLPDEHGMGASALRGTTRAVQGIVGMAGANLPREQEAKSRLEQLYNDVTRQTGIITTRDDAMRAVQGGQETIDALPVHPEFTESVQAGTEAATAAEGQGADWIDQVWAFGKDFLSRAWESEDTSGMIMEQLAELAPQVLTYVGGAGLVRSQLQAVLKGKALQTASMGGGGFLSSMTNTFGPNLTDALQQGLGHDQALARARLQSIAQGSIDAATGAVIPWNVGGSQMLNIPAQTMIQAIGGATGEMAKNAVVGETTPPGDAFLEGFLETLGLPGDVATHLMTKGKDAPADTPPPSANPAAPAQTALPPLIQALDSGDIREPISNQNVAPLVRNPRPELEPVIDSAELVDQTETYIEGLGKGDPSVRLTMESENLRESGEDWSREATTQKVVSTLATEDPAPVGPTSSGLLQDIEAWKTRRDAAVPTAQPTGDSLFDPLPEGPEPALTPEEVTQMGDALATLQAQRRGVPVGQPQVADPNIEMQQRVPDVAAEAQQEPDFAGEFDSVEKPGPIGVRQLTSPYSTPRQTWGLAQEKGGEVGVDISDALVVEDAPTPEGRLENTLQAVTAKGAETGVEVGMMIDQDGKSVLAITNNDPNGINFSDQGIELTQDGRHGGRFRFIHNHPRGTSLSIPDLVTLTLDAMDEIWAVDSSGGGARYRAKATPKTSAMTAEAFTQKARDVEEQVKDEMWEAIDAGRMTPDEAEALHHHRVNTLLQEQGYIEYEASGHEKRVSEGATKASAEIAARRKREGDVRQADKPVYKHSRRAKRGAEGPTRAAEGRSRYKRDNGFDPKRSAASYAEGLSPAQRAVSLIDDLYGDRQEELGAKPRMAVVATHVTNRAKAAIGRALDIIKSAEDRRFVADVIHAETLAAYTGRGNAGEWYQESVAKALANVATAYPEVETDPHAEWGYKIGLAVTSNGQTVPQNVAHADTVYQHFRSQGRFPEQGWGKEAGVMAEGFSILNEMIDAWGIDRTIRFMNTKAAKGTIDTVAGKTINGELVSVRTYGSAVLGPKIGIFAQNLNGNWEVLTMDRWWMRTIGRITGTLSNLTAKQVEKRWVRFENAIKDNRKEVEAYGYTVDEVLNEDDAFMDLAKKVHRAFIKDDYKNKSELRRAAKGVDESAKQMKDSPGGGKDRKAMRQIMEDVSARLEKDGLSLNTAAVQALVWYPEKDLYYDHYNAKAPLVSNTDYDAETRALYEARHDDPKEFRKQADAKFQRGRQSAGANAQAPREAGGSGPVTSARDSFEYTEQRGFERWRVTRSIRREFGSPGSVANAEGAYSATGNRGAGRAGRSVEAEASGQRWAPRARLKNQFKKIGATAPAFVELDQTPANAKIYHDAITQAKGSNKYGAAVYVYPEGDYQHMRLFLSEDATVGFALKGDDIVSLFRHNDSPHKGMTTPLMMLAVQLGGRKLDAFDTALPHLYSMPGFRVVSRLKWDPSEAPPDWNEKVFAQHNGGRPDVVFMAYDPEYLDVYQPGDGQLTDDYGKAVDLQTMAVGQAEKRLDDLRESKQELVRVAQQQVSYSNPHLQSMSSKIGARKIPLRARIKGTGNPKDLFWAFWDRVQQSVFDRFHGLKVWEEREQIPIAQQGYVSARLSTGVMDTLSSLMTDGQVEWRDGVPKTVDGTKGFMEILDPIGDHLHEFSMYLVARRAKEINAKGMVSGFTQDEITAALTEFPQRFPEFDQVATEYAEMNKSVLDFATQAGLINREQRALWESAVYVPFYRIMDEGSTNIPVRGRSGISHQTARIRQLKGSERNIGDVYQNILTNWAHLIDASVKNHSLRLAVHNLKDTGLFEPAAHRWKAGLVSADGAKKRVAQLFDDSGLDPALASMITQGPSLDGLTKLFHMEPPADKDVVKVMIQGKPKYYHVGDPLLLRALTAVNPHQFGPWMNFLRWPKRFLTQMVTADPGFMGANVARDVISAAVTGRDTIVPGYDTVKGLYSYVTKDEDMIALKTAGGTFAAGGYLNAHDPDQVQRHIRQHLKGTHHEQFIVDNAMKLWHLWQAVGNSLENSNRIALGKAALRKGKGVKEAAYETKDIMDFSMRGDNQAVQFLAEVVPFLGARLQGLHRLGRGFHENPTAFALKGSLVMAAALALHAANEDDERYKELEEWDRDTYWHWWDKEGNHWRIPKPFEVGTIFATVPERLWDLQSGDATGEEFWKRMGWNAMATLEMNPTPQAIRPMVELWRNQSFFTGRAIVPQGLQGMAPEAQYKAHTSATARALGQKLGLSPVKLEHAMKGYSGTLGGYILTLLDVQTRNVMAYPQPPTLEVRDYPVVKRFFRGKTPRNTKYVTQMYELAEEADKTYRAVNKYRKESDLGSAERMARENAGDMRTRKVLTTARAKVGDINRAIRSVMADKKRTRIEKRQEVDRLTALKLQLAKGSVIRAKELAAQP